MNIQRFPILLLLISLQTLGCGGGSHTQLVPPAEYGIPDGAENRILDGDEFLGGGHPLEGINYQRNNRSPYLLPASLNSGDSIAPFYDNSDEYVTDYAIFHEMAISIDERIYLGRYLYHYEDIAFAGDIRQKYRLSTFYFDDVRITDSTGGMQTVLTRVGAFSFSRSFSNTWSGSAVMGNKVVHMRNSYSLIRYGIWPKKLVESESSWNYWKQPAIGNYGYFYGDPDMRCFRHLLPYPNESLLVSFTYKDSENPINLQLLDHNLEIVSGWELDGIITGFAYDYERGFTYFSTEAGLYCFDSSFIERWNSTITAPLFAEDLPVISDGWNILGCTGGFLRSINPEGELIAEKDCGAYLRPALLNDRTIVVITDSNLQYFDEQLAELETIPLPSGPGTGSLYTRPPLVDSSDNMALFAGQDLYIIDRAGNIIAQRTFDADIREIRIGPEHLFVALDMQIFRFPS
jgi:hypothetical protein